MKILFYSAYSGFSGSHKMAFQILKACRDAGHEVIAASPDEMEFLKRAADEGIAAEAIKAPDELLQYGKLLLGGSKLGKLKLLLLKILPYNLRMRRWMRKQKIDCVYAAQERAVVLTGLGAKLAGIPLLWHIQGGMITGSVSIHRVSNSLSARLVCVSQAVAETVQEAIPQKDEGRLKVIHNGIPDCDSSGPLSKDADGEIACRILFLGTLVPEKGPHHLLDALGGVKASGGTTFRAKIIGPSQDEGYFRYLESLVTKHDLAGDVEFHEFRDDIPELIDEANLIVCPSVEQEVLKTEFGEWKVDWKEGFCLVAVEAMRASRPVIASFSYGLKEVVADGETGMHVGPGDMEALKNAIEEMAKNPQRRREFGINGRKRFEENFTLEAMTSQFVAEFEAIGKK